MKIINPLFILLLLLITNPILACTDFRITAKDKTVIIARSMEFSVDLKSNLRTSTRGRLYTTQLADGKPGLSWKAKYGYVFLDGFNIDVAIDGMNEEGLSFEALYLPTYAQYQTVPLGHENEALPYIFIGDWILSNFKNISEVKAALPTIYVTSRKIRGMGNIIFPLHFAIYDSSGAGIIVEYVQGKLNIYDNTLGVMTNSPTYDWHITNLNNYIHLKPTNPHPVIIKGMTFASTGQGFGMIGLPGDISPPSRFVKATILKEVSMPATDGGSAINLAEHIINNFDIMRGLAREKEHGHYTNEFTSWVVFKDLTHKIFYYRTYENLTLRAVTLSKLDFLDNAPRLKMPIETGSFILDVTPEFLNPTTNSGPNNAKI